MAKDKAKPKAAKSQSKKTAPKSAAKRPAAKSAVARVTNKTAKLASNPIVGEVVAATLVAAAAALRNPKKARAIAEAAADEIGTASKQISDRGSALWKLAMDVARNSMDAIAGEDEPKKGKKAGKKKSKK